MSFFNSRIWYHILAFIVSGIWGTTFISTKILINYGLTPIYIFIIRFIIAYLGIWILCLTHKPAIKFPESNLKEEFVFFLTGLTGGSLYFYTENTALSYTQASNVAFIVCTAPLFTTILTLLAKKYFKYSLVNELEEVKGRWLLFIGTILAMIGVFIVVFDGKEFTVSSKGDLLSLGASFCWSFYSILIVHGINKFGNLLATRKVFFYGIITAIPIAIMSESCDLDILSLPEVWYNLLFLSIIASLLCFILWGKILSKLGNVTATNYVYLDPFFTLIIGTIVLSERMSFQAAIGCISIITGVILGGIKQKNQ